MTATIDLTPVRDNICSEHRLYMVEGRSKQAFTTWLAARPKEWRAGVWVVAMGGFANFKAVTTEELPDATAMMTPIHVVRLAGDALDQCRCRV